MPSSIESWRAVAWDLMARAVKALAALRNSSTAWGVFKSRIETAGVVAAGRFFTVLIYHCAYSLQCLIRDRGKRCGAPRAAPVPCGAAQTTRRVGNENDVATDLTVANPTEGEKGTDRAFARDYWQGH